MDSVFFFSARGIQKTDRASAVVEQLIRRVVMFVVGVDRDVRGWKWVARFY